MFVATNICHDKSVVVTKIFCRIPLSRQKTCFVFVATKIILVAAPANDSSEGKTKSVPISSYLQRRSFGTCAVINVSSVLTSNLQFFNG